MGLRELSRSLPNSRFGSEIIDEITNVLPSGWQALNEALPYGGLPRGSVVEVASRGGLARATSIAFAACAAIQANDSAAWCAWVEPELTLFAPAVARAAIDLQRFLLVRPPLEKLAQVSIRVATSAAVALVVVDTVGVPGNYYNLDGAHWASVVRRLSIAVQGTQNIVFLLTDRRAHRSLPWPVTLRLELERCTPQKLELHVAKNRFGRTYKTSIPC